MKRATAPLLVIALLATGTPAGAADPDPKAIIARAIKAHGGQDYLAKHPAARAKNTGKLTIPVAGEVEFDQDVSYMLPDKLKDTLVLTVAGQKVTVVTVANGAAVSIEANGKAVEATDAVKKAVADAQYLLKVSRLTTLATDPGYDLSVFGEAKVEDRPAVGVRVARKGQKDVTLFFDATTNLLAKIEHRTLDAATGNEVTDERIVLEYKKDKGGVPLPKKVRVNRDGKLLMEAEVVEITPLETIDDAEFRK